MKKQLSIVNYQLSVEKLLISCFLFLISLFAFHFSLSTVVYATSVDEVVDRIQKKYNAIQDIQGKFFQTSYIKDLERVEKYEGTFFIKKPSSMKWIYSAPRDEEIIIRDTDAWIYRKSAKQVLKSTFSKDTYGQVPIALLNSLGTLKSDFDIIEIKKDMLEIIPKRQTGFIKKIVLEVSSGDFPIKAFNILDINGNKIDIVIKDTKINTGIEDSFFIFKAPSDVEVFEF